MHPSNHGTASEPIPSQPSNSIPQAESRASLPSHPFTASSDPRCTITCHANGTTIFPTPTPRVPRPTPHATTTNNGSASCKTSSRSIFTFIFTSQPVPPHHPPHHTPPSQPRKPHPYIPCHPTNHTRHSICAAPFVVNVEYSIRAPSVPHPAVHPSDIQRTSSGHPADNRPSDIPSNWVLTLLPTTYLPCTCHNHVHTCHLSASASGSAKKITPGICSTPCIASVRAIVRKMARAVANAYESPPPPPTTTDPRVVSVPSDPRTIDSRSILLLLLRRRGGGAASGRHTI